MKLEKSFNRIIANSIVANWDYDALTDYKGVTLQYKDVARKIEKLHIMMEQIGVEKGDKIALCGRNSAHWGVTFLAILSYGAVAVPILHEFNAEQIHNIVNHSEARLLFVGDFIAPMINPDEMKSLEGIINLPDFSLMVSRTDKLDYAREHGPWHVLLQEGRLGEQLLDLRRLGIAGAIAECPPPEDVALIASLRVPVVLLEDPAPAGRRPEGSPLSSAPCVRMDSRGVGRMAADYFLARGYTSFAYVDETQGLFWSAERREGFAEAVRAAGFPCAVFGGPFTSRERASGRAIQLRMVLAPIGVFVTSSTPRSEALFATSPPGRSWRWRIVPPSRTSSSSRLLRHILRTWSSEWRRVVPT